MTVTESKVHCVIISMVLIIINEESHTKSISSHIYMMMFI